MGRVGPGPSLSRGGGLVVAICSQCYPVPGLLCTSARVNWLDAEIQQGVSCWQEGTGSTLSGLLSGSARWIGAQMSSGRGGPLGRDCLVSGLSSAQSLLVAVGSRPTLGQFPAPVSKADLGGCQNDFL